MWWRSGESADGLPERRSRLSRGRCRTEVPTRGAQRCSGARKEEKGPRSGWDIAGWQ